MKLYLHPTKLVTKDYTETLDIEHGATWSSNGERLWPHSFERGEFKDLFAKYVNLVTESGGSIELAIGESRTITNNYNPHGLT